MKKIVLTAVCAAFSITLMAQEAASDKKVQLGLAYQTGMNFNKPGTKIIERDGVGATNSIGVNMNLSFNQNIGLMLGLEFDFESFKYNVVTTDRLYYDYIDSKILKKEDTETGSTLFNLQHRKQKAVYGTIPVMLLFRTNMIGSFRYYGKFGARTGILLSSMATDEGFTFAGNDPLGTQIAMTNSDMKTKSDLFPFRSSIGLAAGAEWNFTGNTSLFAELGFYYGFTRVHYGEAITGDDRERDMSLYQMSSGTADYTTFSSKQKQIVLKVGILF